MSIQQADCDGRKIMRRLRRINRSKKAVTLVELVVAMALTAMFAASCVMLIAPVTKIYTHVNDLSRAQLVADTVVDVLRSECSKTAVTSAGDVWISNSSTQTVPMLPGDPPDPSGPVLVIRRNGEYCETIASNYEITSALYDEVRRNDENPHTEVTADSAYMSRSIYWLMNSAAGSDGKRNTDAHYVHFGYFTSGATAVGGTTYVVPQGYYDFTSPFSFAVYKDYTVDLNFHDLDAAGGTVLCDVSVMDGAAVVYSRTAVLCFASTA